MTTRVVKTEYELEMLVKLLREHKLPMTVNVMKGAKRSVEQNRLQRLWVNEIADQLGDRPTEEVRGECKLTLGVPILRAQNEVFREAYDANVKGLPYHVKLAMMMEPIDLPVTSIMTTAQKTEYLEAMLRHYGEQGVVLTIPDGGLPWRRDQEAA